MELQHATLTQVRAGRDGRRVLVEDDVLGIVRELKEIDPNLTVHWNEYGEFYAIGEMLPDGTESLVTTVPELDARLPEHMRMLQSSGYNYVKEMERQDREAEKAKEHRFSEQVGERGERLAHALRKDLQYGGKAFVPKDVDGE
jgi:hypothetical protein